MPLVSTLTLMVVLATATTPAPPAGGRQPLEPLAEVRGSELVFREDYDSAHDALEIESVWKRVGDDAYAVEVRRKRGAGWESMWTMTLRRADR